MARSASTSTLSGFEFERLGASCEHLIGVACSEIGGGQHPVNSAKILAHREFRDEILADWDYHCRVAALGSQHVFVGGFFRLIDLLRLARRLFGAGVFCAGAGAGDDDWPYCALASPAPMKWRRRNLAVPLDTLRTLPS